MTAGNRITLLAWLIATNLALETMAGADYSKRGFAS